MNSIDDLTPECLGYAGVVYEHVLVSRRAECKNDASDFVRIPDSQRKYK